MRYSTKAWLALGAFIAVIETVAPANDMLSHAVDDWLEHPVGRFIATGVILTTAAHLLNQIPNSVDPFTLAFSWKRVTPIDEMIKP